jgi:hypothetical protein
MENGAEKILIADYADERGLGNGKGVLSQRHGDTEFPRIGKYHNCGEIPHDVQHGVRRLIRYPFPHIEKRIVSPQDVDYSVTRSPEKRN